MVEERTVAAKRRWDKILPHWYVRPDGEQADPAQAAATAASSTDDAAALERAARIIREKNAASKRSSEEMSDEEDNAREPPQDQGGLSHQERADITAAVNLTCAGMDLDEEATSRITEAMLRRDKSPYTCSACGGLYARPQCLPLMPHHYDWQGAAIIMCYFCLQGETNQSRALDYWDPRKLRLTALHPETGFMPEVKIDPEGYARRYPPPPGSEKQTSSVDTSDWQEVMDEAVQEKGAQQNPGNEYFRQQYIEVAPLFRPFIDPTREYTDEKASLVLKLFNSDGTRIKAFPDRKQFVRCARFSWSAFCARRDGAYKKSRGLTYKAFMQDLRARYPQQNHAWIRKALMGTANWWVGALHQAVTQCSTEQRAEVALAFAQWEEEYRKQAFDPSYFTHLATGTLGHQAADMVSSIHKNMHEFYICRNQACLSFTAPDTWFHRPRAEGKKDSDKERWKCPWCYHRYQPWATGQIANQEPVPAQKIFVLKGRAPGEDAPTGGFDKKTEDAMIMAGAGGQGNFSYYLTTWPDTNTTNLQDRLKAIFCELGTAADENPETLQQKFAEIRERNRNSEFFTQEPPSADACDAHDWAMQEVPAGREYKILDEVNPRHTIIPRGRYTYTAGKTHVMSVDDVLTLWALARMQTVAAQDMRAKSASAASASA